MLKFFLACLICFSFSFGCVATSPEANFSGRSGLILDATKQVQGSGFAISEDICVTAFHVLYAGQEPYTINGHEAKIVYLNPTDDFALIQAPHHNLPILKMGSVRLGEQAYSVGYIEFFEKYYELVIPGSVISTNLKDMICFNGGTQHGLSGGPLIDSSGKVIGLTSNFLVLPLVRGALVDNKLVTLDGFSGNPTIGRYVNIDKVRTVFNLMAPNPEALHVNRPNPALQIEIIETPKELITPGTVVPNKEF